MNKVLEIRCIDEGKMGLIRPVLPDFLILLFNLILIFINLFLLLLPSLSKSRTTANLNSVPTQGRDPSVAG